jgi:hypothetical protein
MAHDSSFASASPVPCAGRDPGWRGRFFIFFVVEAGLKFRRDIKALEY